VLCCRSPPPGELCLQDLKDHFGQVGSVRHADVLREAGPGSRSKGCGIVEVGRNRSKGCGIVEVGRKAGQGRAKQCACVMCATASLASSWPAKGLPLLPFEGL
jgi:hypothetical protein